MPPPALKPSAATRRLPPKPIRQAIHSLRQTPWSNEVRRSKVVVRPGGEKRPGGYEVTAPHVVKYYLASHSSTPWSKIHTWKGVRLGQDTKRGQLVSSPPFMITPVHGSTQSKGIGGYVTARHPVKLD